MSRSRAECTSVPLTVASVGRDGIRSMASNRNASGQSVNEEILEGDSDEGSGRAMAQR